MLRRYALIAALGRDIPAIAMTAYGRSEERERAMKAGFRAFVQKAVDAADVARVVADVHARR
jgi:CheY-like chemotaxis protein